MSFITTLLAHLTYGTIFLLMLPQNWWYRQRPTMPLVGT